MNYIDRLADRIAREVDPAQNLTEDARNLFRFYAVLVLVKGEAVELSDVHDAWVAWKSSTDPEHRSNIPFDELSPETQAMDVPYVAAIRSIARHDGLVTA